MDTSIKEYNLRTAIWNSRLDAKLEARYYHYKADKYTRYNNILLGIIFMLLCSIIIAWNISTTNILVPALDIVALLIYIMKSCWRFDMLAYKCRNNAKFWYKQEISWDVIWSMFEEGNRAFTWSEYRKEREKEEDLSPTGDIKYDIKLVSRAQKEVRRAEGLI